MTRRSSAPAVALGIGAIAGLRTMVPPAAIAWALRRGTLQTESLAFTRAIPAKASKRIIELAVSELIADKLPFTPSRLRFKPLAFRLVSGAACGAIASGALKQSMGLGAVLGGLGGLAGAVIGHRVRKVFSREISPFAVALLEDAVAITGSIALVTIMAKEQSR